MLGFIYIMPFWEAEVFDKVVLQSINSFDPANIVHSKIINWLDLTGVKKF